MTPRRVLVARLDNDGDVLLAGPAVRAVAASGAEVTLLAGPRGRHAAALLPGVHDVLVWHCPWIDSDPRPVRPDDVGAFVAAMAAACLSEAVVLTSFHQSPLPLALLLRLAGVARITAESEDYPGSLLDVRHQVPGGGLPDNGMHEVERALATVAAAGYHLPADDDGRLAVRRPLPDTSALTAPSPPGGYVVVHPGASVPARAWDPERLAALVDELAGRGRDVVVTGGPGEVALTARVAGARGLDLGGRTDLAGLAGVLSRAAAVVVGNTGPAHLAAAVGTPVVSLFAPTVALSRWRPYRTSLTVLGEQDIDCAGCRARRCPVPGHPCLSCVTVETAADAVDGAVHGAVAGAVAGAVTGTPGRRTASAVGRRADAVRPSAAGCREVPTVRPRPGQPTGRPEQLVEALPVTRSVTSP